MTLRYHPLAEEDLVQAASFYEEQQEDLGEELLTEVDRGIAHLNDFPRAGTPVGGGLRRYVINRFPYSLLYALEHSDLVIIAVAHHRRDPEYWKERV